VPPSQANTHHGRFTPPNRAQRRSECWKHSESGETRASMTLVHSVG
jgi:hypothetical protein